MQIVFSFNEHLEVSGRVIVADTPENEIILKEIARRMLLVALSGQKVCRCGGKCQQAAQTA